MATFPLVKENDGRCTGSQHSSVSLPHEEDQGDVLAHHGHVLVAELLAHNPMVRVVKEHDLLPDGGVGRVMAAADKWKENSQRTARCQTRVRMVVSDNSLLSAFSRGSLTGCMESRIKQYAPVCALKRHIHMTYHVCYLSMVFPWWMIMPWGTYVATCCASSLRGKIEIWRLSSATCNMAWRWFSIDHA